jgi:hypothetical protein
VIYFIQAEGVGNIKLLVRATWDNPDFAEVKPFGIPLAAVLLAQRQLKALGVHANKTRFRAMSAADGSTAFELLPPPQLEQITKSTIRSALPPDKWPLQMLAEYDKAISHKSSPKLSQSPVDRYREYPVARAEPLPPANRFTTTPQE